MAVIKRIIEGILGIFQREGPPELRDPKRFERHGLTFDYPRDWKIDEVAVSKACVTVFVARSMGSVCSVTLMVPNVGMGIAEYAEGAVEGFQEGLGDALRVGRFQPFRDDGWVVDPVRRRIGARDRDGVRLDVEAGGLGVSFVSRFEIYHLDEPGYGAFVLTNARETEQWDVELPGHEIMWWSLAIDPSASQR